MRDELFDYVRRNVPVADGMLLLKLIQFPAHQLPVATSPLEFWLKVKELFAAGVEPARTPGLNGEIQFVGVLIREYPANEVYQRACDELGVDRATGLPRSAAEPPPPEVRPAAAQPRASQAPPTAAEGELPARQSVRRRQTYPTVVYAGSANHEHFADAVRAADPQAVLAYHSMAEEEGVVQVAMTLTVPLPEDRLQQIRDEMAARGSADGWEIQQRDFDHQPYLLDLQVYGPDHVPYDFLGVPSTTTAGEIAAAVLRGYQDSAVRDRRGQRRRTVVDHAQADGSFVRLLPDQTMHGAGVVNDGVLNVFPEATAGNTKLRIAAVHRVRMEISRYAERHPDFSVEHMDDIRFPTEYELHFRAAGLAPPEVAGGNPTPAHEHTVLIWLGPDFPMRAPLVLWDSPVYHPNVFGPDHHSAPEGLVCLGELMNAYRPTLDFGRLCQTLVDMACYRNYEVFHHDEGGGGWVNSAAAGWARSAEGQDRIRLLGGKQLVMGKEGFPVLVPEVEGLLPQALKVRKVAATDAP